MRLGRDLHQTERKGTYNYCWASGDVDHVIYIDNDLNTFRCTYTVGRKKYGLGKLTYETICDVLHNRTYLDYSECMNCNIGGFCSGGCAQSYKVDKQKQCAYEKENFETFMERVFIPFCTKVLEERENEEVQQYML